MTRSAGEPQVHGGNGEGRTVGATPVPSPVERRIVTVVAEGQEISEEQRKRVAEWLEANGIDHRRVTRGPITIESKARADGVGREVIAFREYYEDSQGRRVTNESTLEGALTYERWVEQKVPLAPDPSWQRLGRLARSDRGAGQ